MVLHRVCNLSICGITASSGVARVIVFFGGGQVASDEGVLGGPPPNFYMDLDFSNGLEHRGGRPCPPP